MPRSKFNGVPGNIINIINVKLRTCVLSLFSPSTRDENQINFA